VSLTQVVRDRVSADLLTPASADLVLRGTVTDYRFRPGVRSPRNELLETGLFVRARGVLWDRTRERVVAGPVRSWAQVGYALDDPFAESEARRRVLDLLAERLVLELLTKEPQEGPTGPPGPSKR
jgi:hypothetical protein